MAFTSVTWSARIVPSSPSWLDNAVAVAAQHVQSGGADVIMAGGLESITMLQNDYNRKNLYNPWLLEHKKDIYMPMIDTAEIVGKHHRIFVAPDEARSPAYSACAGAS